MGAIDVLVTVRREDASRYHKNLSTQSDFALQIISDKSDTFNILADPDQHIDVLVIDNQLGEVLDFITELRHSYPRLIIILVDEQADFALPGEADMISTAPFENDDLIRRITRLMSDRQLETLRADSLPAVRDFAKRLRQANGEYGKQQEAVSACIDLNYDYVAFYRLENPDPLQVILKAQAGPRDVQTVAPRQANPDDIMTWVAKNRQSRIAGPSDSPNHPFITRNLFGAVACVPVAFSGNYYGVLVAFRETAASIEQEQVLMLELVSAQLAAAVSHEIVG